MKWMENNRGHKKKYGGESGGRVNLEKWIKVNEVSVEYFALLKKVN